MNHRSSSNNPDNLPLPVAIHTKSHKLPFNSCWKVYVLHNLPLILITSSSTILNLPIILFCPLDTALVLTSDDFHLIFLPSPPLLPPSCLLTPLVAFFKNSHDSIFTVCSHKITLFSLRKTSVIIKTFQIKLTYHFY